MITERPRRLPGVSYVGFQRYFATACTHFRKPVFGDDYAFGTHAVSQLLLTGRELDFDIVAYCLMPDHAHLLVAGRSETSDFEQFMKRFKQRTGFERRRAAGERLWQPGFHDRILRDDEATLAVARYILENPVRAGLTKALGEWPLAGSGVYTWPELFSLWEQDTRTRQA